ncbi:MAG TPA: 50S ribosomal protein L1 [Acidimicrobiaceae bacterium]|nr:50S ribosomal protein L1 [Acidimicrobiaceae bacterium]
MTVGAKTGKRYSDAARRYDHAVAHDPTEALALVKSLATAKFDESVDLTVRLGVDPRKSDQMVRGTVALPAGSGGTVRVAVFAEGDDAAAAASAGADVVGGADLAERVEGGFTEFDVAIATPAMMAVVGRLGRVLGPRGLMPNPKSGTVTADVGQAVTDFKSGKVEYRTDRYGNVALSIGKAGFTPEDLEANLRAVMEEIGRARPASAKGRYVEKVTLSSTMGPGVRVDTSTLV